MVNIFTMRHLLVIIALVTSWTYCLINATLTENILYEDLKELNGSCHPYDTCREPRYPGNSPLYSCDCDAFCSYVGTCCVDSYFRLNREPTHACTDVNGNGNGVFMVDRCPTDSVFKNWCEDEWIEEDDLMKLVPVTSSFTSFTYKNYFCFQCHEKTDDFFFWNVRINSEEEFEVKGEHERVALTYDAISKTWMAPVGSGGISIPVNLSLEVPYEIWPLVRRCSKSIISNCSTAWSGDETREKCKAYMAVIYTKKDGVILSYRNVHCALCNFEDTEKVTCTEYTAVAFGEKKPFSFTYLLDINRADGDIVGKTKRCEEGSIWDPYAQKCRKQMCALPGFVVKEGKCQSP